MATARTTPPPPPAYPVCKHHALGWVESWAWRAAGAWWPETTQAYQAVMAQTCYRCGEIIHSGEPFSFELIRLPRHNHPGVRLVRLAACRICVRFHIPGTEF